jgi:hypothetical protein
LISATGGRRWRGVVTHEMSADETASVELARGESAWRTGTRGPSPEARTGRCGAPDERRQTRWSRTMYPALRVPINCIAPARLDRTGG